MDTAIEYRNVSKKFDSITAVDNVSFEVYEGELLALLGPSGSGKTTTLRLLAGFEEPTDGEILLNDKDISKYPPHKRDTGMVFQDYALFPHMTVEENIAFGIKRKRSVNGEIDEHIADVLEMVNLEGYQKRKPHELSGGQQQRIATARAVAVEPKVLLMDEPLGALDKKLRGQLRGEISGLQEHLGITTVYVTHNQEEALALADRVAIMNEGEIEQIGTPTEVYNKPKTKFVADFIGEANFLQGDIVNEDDGIKVEYDGWTINVDSEETPNGETAIFVRPENMTVQNPGDENPYDNVITGTVEDVVFMGSKTQLYVSPGDSTLLVESQNDVPSSVSEGDTVSLAWNKEDTHLVEI